MVQEREKQMQEGFDARKGSSLLDSIPTYPSYIKGRDLAGIVGLTSTAEVRQHINALRTAGFPILSTNEGYSMATDSQQIEKCIRSLRSRVASIEGAIAGLYRSFGNVEH